MAIRYTSGIKGLPDQVNILTPQIDQVKILHPSA